jgi:hypothetical protein
VKVLLVTTWQTACGIAEHSAMLKEAVEAADPAISIFPCAEMLDPHHAAYSPTTVEAVDVLHLNYQASLLSRWTPDEIRRWQAAGVSVVVTYHDTGVPNSDQCRAIYDALPQISLNGRAAKAFIVHEPCEDLPSPIYWRMGVPGWTSAYQFENVIVNRRPMLGSIGFPFPWKNYDQLARVTAEAGWDLLLLAPGATAEQEAAWKQINPRTTVCTTFLPQRLTVSWLAGCDATAFCYVCHNTGQSGAVLQGIAARKPVIALRTCRQFRALYEAYPWAIQWCETFEQVKMRLVLMPIARVDPKTVYVAEQDSWARLGQKYATLYRALAGA